MSPYVHLYPVPKAVLTATTSKSAKKAEAAGHTIQPLQKTRPSWYLGNDISLR